MSVENRYFYNVLTSLPDGLFELFYPPGDQTAFLRVGNETADKVYKTIKGQFTNKQLFTSCLKICKEAREHHASRTQGGRHEYGKLRLESEHLIIVLPMVNDPFTGYSKKLIEKIQNAYQDVFQQENSKWEFPKSDHFCFRQVSAEELAYVQNLQNDTVRFKKSETVVRKGKRHVSNRCKDAPSKDMDATILKLTLKEAEILSLCPPDAAPDEKYGGPNANTRYLFGTVSLPETKTDGSPSSKMISATSYFFRVDRNETDNTSTFLPAVIVFSKRNCIDKLQAEAKKSFDAAISWDGREQEELKQSVGRMVYYLSHANPYCRGTGAIIEWLVAGIYRFHGFQDAKHSDDIMLHLEAVTEFSLEEFLESYCKNTDLGDSKMSRQFAQLRGINVDEGPSTSSGRT